MQRYKDLEVKIQLVREPRPEQGYPMLNSPAAVAALFQDLRYEDRECVAVAMLNTPGECVGVHRVSIGTLNKSLIHPREVYKAAILANADSIILAHNHPSGDTKPSQDDIEVTGRIFHAGALLGIELRDHVIIGGDGHVSLRSDKAWREVKAWKGV